MAFMGEKDSAYVDKLVHIGRVAKVVKGGRRFAFSAIVVVGDENGRVGWGSGKAKEVPEAVRKATDAAKKRMVRVNMREGRTIHHEMTGRFGASKVYMRPAEPGTGIIAGGPIRAIFEAMGIKDVVAKSLGSNNPYNMIQATFSVFDQLETPRQVAAKRGLKMADLRSRRGDEAGDDVEDNAKQQEAKPAKKADTKADKKTDSKKAASKPAAKKADTKKASEAKDTAKDTAAKKAAPKKDTAKADDKKADATKSKSDEKAAAKKESE